MNNVLKANRRFIKMERIARLELQGYSDVEIGMFVGITKQYVSMLRQTPEFIQIRIAVASGVLTQLDSDLDESIKMSQEQLKQAVPNAIQILKNTMLNPNLNARLRFDAAKEICDREGTFAKVSKSEIKETKKLSFDMGDAVTNDLLAALQATVSKDEIEGSADFVNTAEQNAKTQTEISKSLENVELATSSIQ